jgi:glutaredoxin
VRLVVLYSRPGCHLCDVAREEIARVRQRHPFAYQEIDIERDHALELEYGLRIPVVTVDGREAFEIAVDGGDLAALVRS